MSEFILALDQGSSSSRALAFDSKGRVAARAQYSVQSFYPKPGFVEHDPAELCRTTLRALDEVLARLPAKAQVLAAGLAAQRSTIVLWDSKTGRPACMAPSWMDGRAAETVAPLSSRQAEIHEKTGLYLTPYYSAPKIRWLLDHEPKARALAEEGRLRIGPVTTYLIWELTKGAVFRIDPAMAQRTLLYNIAAGDWDDDLLKMFGIPRRCLPEVAASTGEWAVLKRKGRKIPLLAVMGDQQSAAYGRGLGAGGAGALNYGTGAFYLLHTGRDLRRVPGLLTSVAWQKKNQAADFFLEGTVHAAGSSLDWLKALGLLKSAKDLDKTCAKASHRVWALASIGGLGAPRWDYRTPASLVGLQAKTRAADIVKGVVESTAFLLADIVLAARSAGIPSPALTASGGLARSNALLQFQADILQQPIKRLKESEATALGAAAMAAQAAGVSWSGNLASGAVDREFLPLMDAETAQNLRKAWTRFVEGQQALAKDLSALGAF